MMDTTAFKRVVYDVARHIGARVAGIEEPRYYCNFIYGALDLGDRTVFLLQSAAGDWSLCSDVPTYASLKFGEVPSITNVLAGYHGIQIHSKAALLGPVVKRADMSDYDLNYWRPKTMGEALFNWWD